MTHYISPVSRYFEIDGTREEFFLAKPEHTNTIIDKAAFHLKGLRAKWEGRTIPKYLTKSFEDGSSVYELSELSFESLSKGLLFDTLPLAGKFRIDSGLSFKPSRRVSFLVQIPIPISCSIKIYIRYIRSAVDDLLEESGLIKDRFFTRIVWKYTQEEAPRNMAPMIHIHAENDIDSTMIAMVILSHDLPLIQA